MAQVNSEPGKNQTFGNLAVPASQLSTQHNPGVGLAPAFVATITTVTYGQIEPGTSTDGALRPKRS